MAVVNSNSDKFLDSFIAWLKTGGIDVKHFRRVIIDISMDAPVHVYVESMADESLSFAPPTVQPPSLVGAKITVVGKD